MVTTAEASGKVRGVRAKENGRSSGGRGRAPHESAFSAVVCGGVRLTTSDGLRPGVEAAANPQRELPPAAALTEGLKVRTSALVGSHEAGTAECVRIETRLGNVAEIGRECRLVGFSGVGAAPVRAGDVAPGDWLAAPRRVPVFGGEPLPGGHALFLALMTSDGNLWSSQTPALNNSDPELVAAFSESVRGIEGVEVSPRADGENYGVVRDARAQAVGGKNAALLLLERHGLLGTRTSERFVPDGVFALPREDMAAYLGALWSGDGSAYHHRGSRGETGIVFYWSASRRMVEDVQHLLLRFGVVAKLRVAGEGGGPGKPGSFYALNISEAENIRAFADSVGRRAIGREAEKLRGVVALLPETGRPTLDVVPAGVWDAIERARASRGLSRRAVDTGAGVATRKRKNLSRRKMLAVAELLGEGDLLDIAESDVIWDRVDTVEGIGRRRVWESCWDRSPGAPSPLGLMAGHLFLAGSE